MVPKTGSVLNTKGLCQESAASGKHLELMRLRLAEHDAKHRYDALKTGCDVSKINVASETWQNAARALKEFIQKNPYRGNH